MNLLMPAMIGGLVLGSLYALIALAIVLLFRTTGVANFAVGNMAMFSAFIVFRVAGADFGIGEGRGLGSAVTRLLLGSLVGAALGFVIYWIVIKPSPGFGTMNLTFRTLGLYILLAAIANRLWAARQPYTAPGFASRGTFEVAGFGISYDQLSIMAVAAVGGCVLFFFFGRTGLGLTMRAVASHRESASLCGIDARKVEMTAWVISGVLAALVGLLFAPVRLLSTNMMDAFLVVSFTAAILGGIFSFAGAIVGGILLGMVYSVAGVYVTSEIREAFFLVTLLAVLALKPFGIFGVVSGEGRV